MNSRPLVLVWLRHYILNILVTIKFYLQLKKLNQARLSDLMRSIRNSSVWWQIHSDSIPYSIKRAKIIFILKSEKPNNLPQSYRPIAYNHVKKIRISRCALAFQHQACKTNKTVLTKDPSVMTQYLRKWRLYPSPAEAKVWCYLNNKVANRELEIHFKNTILTYHTSPTYEEVTLDGTLSFQQHLTKTVAQLNSRNNILDKVCGKTWRFSAIILRCSGLFHGRILDSYMATAPDEQSGGLTK